MPSQIDESSIQKVMEAASGMKATMSDDKTELTPHVVASGTTASARWCCSAPR